ncbi:hypothetical protein MPER_05286 [Moniliophthora perniciosa FA553]|nr:hypothetical protein MPER_05286 [Moniliophthora perniciosa FA553]
MFQLMCRYFEMFGDKTCCYEDMKPYLILSPEDVSKWTDFLESHSQCIQGLPLGDDFPSTELQPVDDLAILAASVFVNIWKLTGKEQYLFDAAIMLEYGLTRSKQSFQMRLMLIRVYRLMGAPMAALEHYRLLRVKQIQNDTLSHFVLSRASMFSLAATGDLTFSTECIEASQIYLTNSQEVGYLAQLLYLYLSTETWSRPETT